MSLKSVKISGVDAKRNGSVAASCVALSHAEVAERITQITSTVTSKEDARKLLRSAGILNKNNKLVKALR